MKKLSLTKETLMALDAQDASHIHAGLVRSIINATQGCPNLTEACGSLLQSCRCVLSYQTRCI